MKIKEVQEQLNVSSNALRYYEKMGLIHPLRDKNGYRNYSIEDVAQLKKVIFLRELDISIEDIIQMLNHTTDFQETLTKHMQSIEIEIQSLQAIKELCVELKNKDIPLLDTIIEKNIQQDFDKKEIKTIFEKVTFLMKPIETTVIGTRVTPRDYLYGLLLCVIIVLLILLGVAFGIPHMIDYVLIQAPNIHLPHIFPSLDFNINNIMIFVVVSFIISVPLLLYNNSVSQNYIELVDGGIYICHKKYLTKWEMMKGSILKRARHYNRYYYYEDIEHVDIYIVFSTMGSRGGIFKIYLPHFQFHFNDGEVYEIDSGISLGEDSRTAYQILKNKNVKMNIEPLIEEYYNQNELKGYDFFEKYYGLNTPRGKD